MFGIGISEIIVILIVFVIVVRPQDYKEIILQFKKIVAVCLSTKNQIMHEINSIADGDTKKDIDALISDLADGEIKDEQGNFHKYYKLENVFPRPTKDKVK